jgi:hypothetical protein
MWRRVSCEQQLNMSQSVLRDTVKTGPKVLVIERCYVKPGVSRKGIGLIFPNLNTETD